MAKRKLTFLILLLSIISIKISYADPNLDQWMESEKTYKDLVNENYEVKSYSISEIQTDNGLLLLLFITVLQKDNEVYECQEYQTMDKNLETLDMSLVCKQLVQPYKSGIAA